MQSQPSAKELRQFGLLVGWILLLIGAWPLVWRGESVRLWALVPGTLLVPLGALVPTVLGPVYKIWMKLGHALGWVNTRIILGVIYFGLITPMGLVMRLFGWDSMHRAFIRETSTYRVVRPPRPPSHMTRQF